jgi:Peptidase A4 family
MRHGQPGPTRRRAKLAAGAGALVALALALPAAAAAAAARTSVSNNWSGYAVRAHGVTFDRVSGSWREPVASCTAGAQTYSAFWVGIGGYSLNSAALEQIGSELDCRPDGHQSISAWYELVPAPSRTVRLRVRPHDLLRASVTIAGDRVTMKLADLTSGGSFSKSVVDRELDVTSAEWIAEAPSECYADNHCRTLPLTDYRSIAFSDASARTSTGRTGTISSRWWQATKILLRANGQRFLAFGAGGDGSGAKSTPGALERGGRAFAVSYSAPKSSSTTPPYTLPAQPSPDGSLYRPR